MTRDNFMDEGNADFWANERDCPYVEMKPFSWFRGYQVGGRSCCGAGRATAGIGSTTRPTLRKGSASTGRSATRDMAPWYDHVESFAGISGSLEGLEQLPDGKFLPPMELNVAEKSVAARIRAHYKDARRMIIGRVANLSEPHGNRVNCQYRNKCHLGCPFGAYFSTQSATLPAAVATGNLTLRPFSIVTRILYDKDRKRAKGVEVLDAETGQVFEYSAKIVFLCASTLNSAWVLMNSATDVWPDGLGSSSGELGHNIMDHHFRVGATGEIDGFRDRYVYGRRANGFYIPRFRNLFDDRRPYRRGYGYQGSASRENWARELAEMGRGRGDEGIAARARRLADWHDRVWGNPARPSQPCYPRPKPPRQMGPAVLAMDCELRDNDRQMRVDMANDAAEMLEAGGVKNVKTYDNPYSMGQGIHEMGSARMGRDPNTSVLNRYNQVWDAPNVFVTDGSCMTSASCVNPSLTYMALTARAANHAVEALKKGDL
jgi:choline dehydrogenase-like flavoprotein